MKLFQTRGICVVSPPLGTQEICSVGLQSNYYYCETNDE